ncbi:MAG: hypothetical protein R2878_13205 [Thermoleophilia bacterium]
MTWIASATFSEQQLGTKPNNGDSNTNGIPDGLEVVAAAETIRVR